MAFLLLLAFSVLSLDKVFAFEKQCCHESKIESTAHLEQQTDIERLLESAAAHREKDDYEREILTYHQVLTLQREIGDLVGSARTHHLIGRAYRALNQYSHALFSYESSMAAIGALEEEHSPVAQDEEFQEFKGRVLNDMGVAYINLGQYQEAVTVYQQALQIFEHITRSQTQWVNTLKNLGEAYYRLGELAKALELLMQTIPFWQAEFNSAEMEYFYRQGEALTHQLIGDIRTELGQYEQAESSLQSSIDLFGLLGDRYAQAKVLNSIASVYAEQEQYELAAKTWGQALLIIRELDNLYHEGRFLNNLGWMYTRWERYAEAMDILEEALPIVREMGNSDLEGDTLSSLGEAYQGLGRTAEALDAYQQSQFLLQASGSRVGLAENYSLIGSLFTDKS
ncbi:MAG: tetratricopeptide repeat protein, partial [Elainellaceae cyanobacterium]